jgi:two-component system NtrC family response regulator
MNAKPSQSPAQSSGASAPFRALVVEDIVLYAQAIKSDLERCGIACDLAHTAADALALAQSGAYQAILLDHKLPDDDGIRIIPILLGRQTRCALIVMTAYETIPNAIQAIRQGAEDYIVKQTSIQPIVQRLLEIRRRNDVRMSGAGWDEHRKAGLIGQSPGMVLVREQVERVAGRQHTSVLFTGETGVGKEVAARSLHQQSAPASSPFLSVDCVALPANLVESLLFGHEKGAFTGAHKTVHGVFQEAGEGTVLLDEIGDMDLSLQGKLLRVLETRRFQRVGSVREIEVRARIVAATNRDLLELVRQGRFRFDLYQRLSVFPIAIPALRERGEDILLAARHFIDFFAAKMNLVIEPLSAEVQQRLLGYDYPGNMRELKNIIERAIILADAGRIELQHLPERILSSRIPIGAAGPTGAGAAIDFIPGVDTMETLEEKLIIHALKQTKGAKTEAARLLGISRFQLLRRMQKYRLQPGATKSD